MVVVRNFVGRQVLPHNCRDAESSAQCAGESLGEVRATFVRSLVGHSSYKFPEHAAIDARFGHSDFIEDSLVEILGSSASAWHRPVHDEMGFDITAFSMGILHKAIMRITQSESNTIGKHGGAGACPAAKGLYEKVICI